MQDNFYIYPTKKIYFLRFDFFLKNTYNFFLQEISIIYFLNILYKTIL